MSTPSDADLGDTQVMELLRNNIIIRASIPTYKLRDGGVREGK